MQQDSIIAILMIEHLGGGGSCERTPREMKTNVCSLFSFEHIQITDNDHDNDHANDHGVEDLHGLEHEGMNNDALVRDSFEPFF
jgi:hypothetical protein